MSEERIFTPAVYPLVISNDKGWLCKLKYDGELETSEHYVPSEAAKIFWQAMGGWIPAVVKNLAEANDALRAERDALERELSAHKVDEATGLTYKMLDAAAAKQRELEQRADAAEAKLAGGVVVSVDFMATLLAWNGGRISNMELQKAIAELAAATGGTKS